MRHAIVLVMRVDEGEPYVPSDIIRSDCCGAQCYISKITGIETIKAAALLSSPPGCVRIVCVNCMGKEIETNHESG